MMLNYYYLKKSYRRALGIVHLVLNSPQQPSHLNKGLPLIEIGVSFNLVCVFLFSRDKGKPYDIATRGVITSIYMSTFNLGYAGSVQ